jgi:phage regulator Rha-like protein
MENNELITSDNFIKDKIHTIRDKQVILDYDLAKLYEVETRILNQSVKRNLERFPDKFMFQLNKDEIKHLKSQFVISKWGGKRKLPFAFTEQGVAMLSSVLKSKKAIKISIKIIEAFISMRKFLIQNQDIFNRLDNVERKQIKTEEKIDEIFDYMQLTPSQGIFFNGQVFDAYLFISNLIKKERFIYV